MQSENDVILTTRPRGAERSVVYVRSCIGSLRWSPSLQWKAVFEVPRLQKPLRGTAVRVVRSSSDAKERHRRPCTQEDISCLLAISGRSAACSLFLADQRQRYYSILRCGERLARETTIVL